MAGDASIPSSSVLFGKNGGPCKSYRPCIIYCMHSGISIDQPYRTSKPCPRSTFLVTAAPAVFCHVTWLRWSMATMPSRVQSGKIGLGLFAWQGKAKSFLMWVIEVSSQIQVSFGSYLSFKSLDKQWSGALEQRITAQFGGVELASDVASWHPKWSFIKHPSDLKLQKSPNTWIKHVWAMNPQLTRRTATRTSTSTPAWRLQT